ncbi:MAG TPA: hypothetical protein P5514_11130 [Bacteroidales bacterium]|nr:hypothetical protein [Bacteroidales bacterium]HRX97490.1 hypothetical protein [Bacteroidales bacterium]
MERLLHLLFCLTLSVNIFAQTRTIHVFVALCDNEYQGIVPVPEKLGNGKDTKSNLYWGAAYGVKTYFINKTDEWKLISTLDPDNPKILERLLFKHNTEDVYLLADAWDGEEIKACTEDFLKTSNGQLPLIIEVDSLSLSFGGLSDLIAYSGHDGLMDFSVDIKYEPVPSQPKEVIILACFSKRFFSNELKQAGAIPLLWTTHLMAPEAYTLKAAIDGWIENESGEQIKERAAQAYHKYQKCGIKGARNLFSSGF